MPKTRSTRTRRKPCRVRVPASFDPEVHLPHELRKHADSARYLLNCIIWGYVRNKQDLRGYVPLKFLYLREVIPDRVIKPLKDALWDSGVIDCDGHYIEGHKSHGYKLGEEVCDDRIVQVPISTQATANKITKIRRSQDRKVRLDVHCWLRSKFRDLSIDLPAAMEELSGHHDFESVKIPVEEIADKDIAFSVCRFGRVHTPLTRLSRRVRRYLTVEGERLVNLDIKNSQPLFLALLMMNYRRRGNKTFGYITFKENVVDPYKNIDDIIESTVSPFIFKKDNSFIPPLSAAVTNRKAIDKESKVQYLQTLTTTSTCPYTDPKLLIPNRQHLHQDEALFLRLCEEGGLYEHLAILTDEPVRQWVKEEFFEVLFSQNRYQSRLKSAFAEEFPHVAEVIRVHKRRKHEQLAQLLQNIESNFMINNVVRRIMEQTPDAPIYTIHDSVMTTPEHVDRVHRIMEAEFAYLGLTPSIKADHYGEQHKRLSEGLTEPLVGNAG